MNKLKVKYSKESTRNPLPLLKAGTEISTNSGEYVIENSKYQEIREFPKVGMLNGTLMLIGGGKISNEIYDFYKAIIKGKAKTIVITTANCREEVNDVNHHTLNNFKLNGIELEYVIHTRDRYLANKTEFYSKLSNSHSIWMTGGGAECLITPYLHSAFHKKLKEFLENGGIIAGTSAGAVAMGSYFETLHGEPRVGRVAFEGFGFLNQVIIATHIDTYRSSLQENIIDVIDMYYPGFLGIGIEENTAAVVNKDILNVIGTGLVVIYDGFLLIELSKGMKYDLGKRKKIDKL